MKIRPIGLLLFFLCCLLGACGGGGGARSPDRLGSTLDPDTLRINFPDFPSSTPVLAATGNNSIAARMLGLQTDGVEFNLGPELNVTDQTQWRLDGPLGDPVLVELAEQLRDAASLGTVQDILSTVRLLSTDSSRTLTLVGLHGPSGRELSADFILRPPVAVGDPFINGPEVFALDPINPTGPVSAAYQLLQNLQGVSSRENRSNQFRFCSSNSAVLSFAEPQPPQAGVAMATINNPFPGQEDKTSVSVEVFALDPEYACADRNTVVEGITVLPVASLTVQIIPAVVADGGMAVCAVLNPASNACDPVTGEYLGDMSQCRGLDADSIVVPAGERVQMVARLSFTNPHNLAQSPFVIKQCLLANHLSWDASPDTIFSGGLDAEGGFGSLIGQTAFEVIADTNPASEVTGSYDNLPGSTADQLITDSLTLQLGDAEVTAIEIIPVDHAPGAEDTLYLNLLREGISYRAECTFGRVDQVVASCSDSCVSWSVSDAQRIQVSPANNSARTTVSASDGALAGTANLIAQYSCGAELSDSREITLEDDEVVELHLLQQSNGSAPNVRSVDEFSCVGRTDLVGTLADGASYIQGDQKFYAHALFESGGSSWDEDPASLPDVTAATPVRFMVTPGYADAEGNCSTLALGGEGGVLPDNGPVADFNETEKGVLNSTGLLRLSTVCVQAFEDKNANGSFDSGVDLLAEQSSTVLVLPAADDELLNFSNELCEILEPVLTLGSGIPGIDSGLVVPLVYGLSLVTDPILASLTTTDYGGVLPVEELIHALITGEFSVLSVGDMTFEDAPFGLGAITGGLLGGVADIPGVEALVDVLDACLLDPVLFTVESLLTGLLTLDSDALAGLADINFEQCQGLFGG